MGEMAPGSLTRSMATVAVSSSSQLAADAGARIAGLGGNAVDAAIAAVLVAMVTELGIIAPGASGFITISTPDADPVVIDAYAEMPGRGLPHDRFGGGGRRVWLGYGGGMETIVGWGSVATPGAFAGLHQAHSRNGFLPWERLLAPAIAIDERGFPLSVPSGLYLAFSHELVYGWDAESSAIVHRDGRPLAAGDHVFIPYLGATFSRLALIPGDLYTGALARSAAAAAEAGGGILTDADLAEYHPVSRDPITVPLGDWTVATNPAPAVGGATMAALVLLMTGDALSAWDAETLRRYADVQGAVLRYRRERLDPYGERAAAARDLLETARRGRPDELLSSPSTVHTSAVDSEGTAIALTLSAGYGSGAMIPGTGFWMNNSLGEIELAAEGYHALPPGTRLISNMAPTIATRDDGAVLALGSPGADRITTAVASVLLNHLHLGMPLQEAVDHPRMHVE
ncbi:MAG: gamma-glutamyltransferase, partial [Actinobacteria bacterium]